MKKIKRQEFGLLLIGISGISMLLHNNLLEEANAYISIVIAIGALAGLVLFASKRKKS